MNVVEDGAAWLRRSRWIDRRRALGLMAGAGGALAAGSARPADPLAGAAMLQDVRSYDALGEHRTGTTTDNATSQWLMRRLREAGASPSLQAFPSPLFVPSQHRIDLAGASIFAFPGWPVAPTPQGGVTAPLALHDAASITGKIAVIRLAYRPGGSWAAPGFGDTVMAAVRRNAAAVIVITDGPTGDVIALNAVPSRFAWPIPVVIAGGRNGDDLVRAAASGATARLVSTGTLTRGASATNVIAHRPGRGKTIAVSTPKSGWFHCAGERGTGIALFLGLAGWLTRHTDADLLFACLSGHELDEIGAAHFLRTGAPAPQQTRVWFHIGANAAMQGLGVENGAVVARPPSGPSRLATVSRDFLPAAQRAFSSQAGYVSPSPIDTANAVGDLSVFNAAGYETLVGLLGANPLFHTQLDRADVATTPAVLETVAGASRDFLQAFV